MIHLSEGMVNLVFGVVVVTGTLSTWLFMKREVTKVRADYFARHGHYPGEPAPKPDPAE